MTLLSIDTQPQLTAAAVYDVFYRFNAHFNAIDQTKVLESVRTSFPNKRRKNYSLNAMTGIKQRSRTAVSTTSLAYRYFIKRQPDGYVAKLGKPTRLPYLPTEEETQSLEAIADYILADDHARGLTILRDPYDKPRDVDVWTPPGEGAVEFMRARLTEEDVVTRLLDELPAMRRNAYARGDYEAVEYIVDVEAAIHDGIVPPVNHRYVPDIDNVHGTDVKYCAVCDYPFEDRSRNKMAQVCGEKCRRRYKTLWQRVDRYGTEQLEGERERMDLEYPFYSPAELWSLENRSERSYGDSEKLSGMEAARLRKEQHGVKNTVKLSDVKGTKKNNGLDGVYTWESNRNRYKFNSWFADWRWGEVVSYNMNEQPLTEKFVESRGLAAGLCPWLN